MYTLYKVLKHFFSSMFSFSNLATKDVQRCFFRRFLHLWAGLFGEDAFRFFLASFCIAVLNSGVIDELKMNGWTADKGLCPEISLKTRHSVSDSRLASRLSFDPVWLRFKFPPDRRL